MSARREPAAESSRHGTGCEIFLKELQPDGDSIKDYEYDAAGNTTKDPDGREFIYDGENKQIHVKNSTGGTIGQ